MPLLVAGALDIASKNIQLGSSKLITGLMTSLYLGFGLTLGSDVLLRLDIRDLRAVEKMTGSLEYFYGTFYSTNETTPEHFTPPHLTGVWVFAPENATTTVVAGCMRDMRAPWYGQSLPWWTLFFLLPLLNVMLSMRRAQPLKSVELPVMVFISCTSSAVMMVAKTQFGLAGHPEYSALIGSFVVSLLGNVYARRYGGMAFTIMVTGIWLLIPLGLVEAGGLASPQTTSEEDVYTQAIDLATKSQCRYRMNIQRSNHLVSDEHCDWRDIWPISERTYCICVWKGE